MEMHEIYKKNRIVETSELKLTGSNLYQIIESSSDEIVMQEIAASVGKQKISDVPEGYKMIYCCEVSETFNSQIPYLYDNRPILTGSKVILSLDEYVPTYEWFKTKVNNDENKFVFSQLYLGEFDEEFSEEYMKENNLAARIKDREEIQ